MGVFMTSIADAAVGGTYMTFLNTLSNLGGTWPRYFVLEAVDWFSKAQCHFPATNGKHR
jgi:PAT family acetyl-CoA transporter-like MFS transporter 1